MASTSTERMRRKRQRELGLAPPLKKCKICDQKLKKGAGSNKAWEMDLCWKHWKETDEGRIERRRQNLKGDPTGKDVWGVLFFGGDPPEHFSSLRKALSASTKPGRATNLPVYVVWCDGRVTVHNGLTARTAVYLSPKDGDVLLMGGEWFRSFVPEPARAWFAC